MVQEKKKQNKTKSREEGKVQVVCIGENPTNCQIYREFTINSKH